MYSKSIEYFFKNIVNFSVEYYVWIINQFFKVFFAEKSAFNFKKGIISCEWTLPFRISGPFVSRIQSNQGRYGLLRIIYRHISDWDFASGGKSRERGRMGRKPYNLSFNILPAPLVPAWSTAQLYLYLYSYSSVLYVSALVFCLTLRAFYVSSISYPRAYALVSYFKFPRITSTK